MESQTSIGLNSLQPSSNIENSISSGACSSPEKEEMAKRDLKTNMVRQVMSEEHKPPYSQIGPGARLFSNENRRPAKLQMSGNSDDEIDDKSCYISFGQDEILYSSPTPTNKKINKPKALQLLKAGA